MENEGKRKQFAELALSFDQYHTPRSCMECGGIMIFKGVGEYQCEECAAVAYDDYGKVRCYLEKHKGATAAEVESGTGVKQKTIRQMLKEERLQVAEDSKAFMICEMCGVKIRSGRLCVKCQVEFHRSLEQQQRQERQKSLQGHGMTQTAEEGAKRFRRE